MKFDLHMHTFRSSDCLSSYDAILAAVQRRGLDGIAVTDHNTIRGALELRERAPFPVIVGEEVATAEGDVIGYFIEEEIPRGLSVEETIARIHAQGGLVAIPHPLDSLRGSSSIGREVLLRVIEQVDIIEGFNARCLRQHDNEEAQAIARQYGKPVSAGSDAHHPSEIGNGYVEIPPFNSPQTFLEALRHGRWHGRPAGWHVKWYSTWPKIVRKIRPAR